MFPPMRKMNRLPHWGRIAEPGSLGGQTDAWVPLPVPRAVFPLGERSDVRPPLCCDKGLQGNAVGNDQGCAVLLDEVLLLESREEPSDGLARSTNHLADLFVS